MEGRVIGDTQRDDEGKELPIPVRDKFKQAADSLVLPAFMIRDGEDWRPVHYEPDLLSRVPWDKADVSPVHDLVLTAQPDKNVTYHKGIEDGVLANDPEARAEFLTSGWDDDLDYAFAASHLLDVMPNPWRGNEIARRVFEHLRAKYPRKLVMQNYVFVLDELHRQLGSEKDWLTREVFHDLLKSGVMRFMVVAENLAAKGLHNKPPRQEMDRYHFPAIDSLFNQSVMREAATQEFLTEAGVVPLTLTYEDLVCDHAGTVRTVLRFLEVPEEDVQIRPPSYERLADKVSEEWVQRFRQEKQQGWERTGW